MIYSIFIIQLLSTPASELESILDAESDSDASSRPRKIRTHSDRIEEVLALLRGARQGPFDLVLEILDEDKPEYVHHRAKFYGDNNTKLFELLDIVAANAYGRNKIRTWLKQSQALKLICDIVSEEMNAVQKADQLPGIAAVDLEFLNNWAVSSDHEVAPCLFKILRSAAQTTRAQEQNKIKTPDVV